MAYFPHAYKKVFVASAFTSSGKTQSLFGGQLGFFNPNTWTAINVANANVGLHPRVVLAMGSYHFTDKVGAQGGYGESIKSQIIYPHHVHAFLRRPGRAAQQQVVDLKWESSEDGSFVCGKTYFLRVDLKGSPALRLLGRNAYHTFDHFTGCCTDTGVPVPVDPISVLLGFAKQINEHPVFSKFVAAVVFDGMDAMVDPEAYEPLTDAEDIASANGYIRLTVIYEDTYFGRCSYDPSDHYELEPVVVTSAQLVNDDGALCSGLGQLDLIEVQAAVTADGTGARLMHDWVMSNNYRQEVYSVDPRRREVEDMHGLFDIVQRDSTYDTYYILHTVPRHANPTSVYDGDLYLLQVTLPNSANFEDWFTGYLASAGMFTVIDMGW